MVKKNKIAENFEHNNLIKLLEFQSPKDRQKLLQNIDNILCGFLEIESKDLPWINPNKHSQKWEKLMRNLRLVIGRLEFEFIQKERILH